MGLNRLVFGNPSRKIHIDLKNKKRPT